MSGIAILTFTIIPVKSQRGRYNLPKQMELKPHVSQTVLVVKREHIVSHMLENARYSKPISLYLVYPHVYPHVCWWNHIGLFGEVKSFWPITSEILLHHPASLLKLHTWKSWILKDSSLHLSTSPLICSRKVKIFMDLDGFWWDSVMFSHLLQWKNPNVHGF